MRSVAVAAALSLAAALLLWQAPLARPEAAISGQGGVSHPPILIVSDAEFTPANGVVGGTGTPNDPYLIRGWDINASETHGIVIRNTSAPVVIRDVFVHSGWNHTYTGNFSNLAFHSGIYLWNAANVRIENVTLSDNGEEGLYLESVMNVTVLGSDFASNSAFGIYGYGIDLAILNNTFRGQGIGFRGGGWNVLLSSNDFYGNEPGGVLIDWAQNLTIRENNFADSLYGEGIDLYTASNASVYHNNILDDWYHSRVEFGANNAWDAGYPAGGNYWSLYSGEDNCSGPLQDICPNPDGIGDTPFQRYAGDAIDRYPLMHPFGSKTQPPTAVLQTTPSNSRVAERVTVNASASHDPDGPDAALLYRWDWEADGTWDTSWTASLTSEHAYEAPGTYIIRMEVRDVMGWANVTTGQVTVNPPPLVPDYSWGLLLVASGIVAAVFYLYRRRKRRRAARWAAAVHVVRR